MRTFVFKPEFEKKLKRLGIKRKFIKNVKWDWQDTLDLESALKYLNTKKSWDELLIGSFYWDETEEGHDYWYNISKL